MSGGFGNAQNHAIDHLVEYGGKLYAATWNEQTGGEIWRSADGDNWDWVGTGGFGDPNQAEIFCLAVFKNAIYAGTMSYSETSGGQIWRSTTAILEAAAPFFSPKRPVMQQPCVLANPF